MAYGDYGALLPTEALFTEPGAYSGVLKSEALKRASYLSSMDQFYAELEESTKRFEKQYSLAEREFESGQEQAVWEREFAETSREWERDFAETGRASEAALTTQELSLRAELGRGELALGKGELALAESELAFGREQLAAQPQAVDDGLSEAEEFKMATDWLSELYGSTPSSSTGTYTPERSYEPTVFATPEETDSGRVYLRQPEKDPSGTYIF